MTKRTGINVIVQRDADDVCELCERIAELRPYGPNGEQICVECGSKNPEQTQKRMRRQLFGGLPEDN